MSIRPGRAGNKLCFFLLIFTWVPLEKHASGGRKRRQIHHNTGNAFTNFPQEFLQKGLDEDSKYRANLIFLKLILEENGFLVVEESEKLVRGGGRGRAARRTSGGGKEGGKMSGIFSPNFRQAASSLPGWSGFAWQGEGWILDAEMGGFIFSSCIFFFYYCIFHLTLSPPGTDRGTRRSPLLCALLSQLFSVRLNTREGVFPSTYFLVFLIVFLVSLSGY